MKYLISIMFLISACQKESNDRVILRKIDRGSVVLTWQQLGSEITTDFATVLHGQNICEIDKPFTATTDSGQIAVIKGNRLIKQGSTVVYP